MYTNSILVLDSYFDKKPPAHAGDMHAKPADRQRQEQQAEERRRQEQKAERERQEEERRRQERKAERQRQEEKAERQRQEQKAERQRQEEERSLRVQISRVREKNSIARLDEQSMQSKQEDSATELNRIKGELDSAKSEHAQAKTNTIDLSNRIAEARREMKMAEEERIRAFRDSAQVNQVHRHALFSSSGFPTGKEIARNFAEWFDKKWLEDLHEDIEDLVEEKGHDDWDFVQFAKQIMAPMFESAKEYVGRTMKEKNDILVENFEGLKDYRERVENFIIVYLQKSYKSLLSSSEQEFERAVRDFPPFIRILYGPEDDGKAGLSEPPSKCKRPSSLDPSRDTSIGETLKTLFSHIVEMEMYTSYSRPQLVLRPKAGTAEKFSAKRHAPMNARSKVEEDDEVIIVIPGLFADGDSDKADVVALVVEAKAYAEGNLKLASTRSTDACSHDSVKGALTGVGRSVVGVGLAEGKYEDDYLKQKVTDDSDEADVVEEGSLGAQTCIRSSVFSTQSADPWQLVDFEAKQNELESQINHLVEQTKYWVGEDTILQWKVEELEKQLSSLIARVGPKLRGYEIIKDNGKISFQYTKTGQVVEDLPPTTEEATMKK